MALDDAYIGVQHVILVQLAIRDGMPRLNLLALDGAARRAAGVLTSLVPLAQGS